MKLFNKKIMLTLLFSFATLSFSNDGAAFKNLEKQLAKREKIEKTISNMNAENKDIVQQNIKTKLSILSGKSAAAENISTEFNYYKNSVYEIFAKPNYITTLKLNSDENLVYVGGGDVENWQIDETNGGSENATYLMIKPSFPNLKTNLSVITDKRSYFIVLESTDNSYNPYISWKYPYDEGMAHIKKIQEKTKSKDVELNAKEINQIEFGYTYNKNSKIKLIYAGKFSRSKGIIYLLKAFEKIKDKYNIELILAGSGTGNEFEEIIDYSNKLKGKVKLYGYMSKGEISDLFRDCDIFVMPSFYEGLSLVTIEALACGLKVVMNELENFIDFVGKEITESNNIVFVKMPVLYDTDKILEMEVEEYINRLSLGLEKQINNLYNYQHEKDFTAKIIKYSWKNICNDIINIVK